VRMVHRCLLDGYQQEFGLVERFGVAVTRLEEFFREAVAAGEMRVSRPEILARSIVGPTFVLFLWSIHEGERFTVEELAEPISEMLLNGLVIQR
jgi:hypothetical protein